MIQTRQDWRTRWERPLAGGLSEVTSLSMPLRRGIWYAMVVHGRGWGARRPRRSL